MQARWANLQAIDVKFSQYLTHRNSLTLVNFDRVILKIKSGRFSLGHSVILKLYVHYSYIKFFDNL